jgi:hypothetical protein
MRSAYLRAMHAAFESAWSSAARREVVTLEVDGTVVCLKLAGSEMAAAVLPALAPLVSAPTVDPDFTVELWDSASAGVQPPAPDWGESDAGPLGAVRGHNDELVRTVVDHGSGTVTVADLAAAVAVVWAASARALPDWWRAQPLRSLLGSILARPGRHVVHAGAVGFDGRAVMLAGAGGAGKSTLAVTCLEAGMHYLGDDYVLLSAGHPPLAHALYATAKLDRRSLEALPELEPHAIFQGGDKAVLNLAALRPSLLRRKMPIVAIATPRFGGGAQSAIRPVAAAIPYRALAISTVFQGQDGAQPAMSLLAEVVRTVPTYELEIGGDLRSAAELLRTVVAAAS